MAKAGTKKYKVKSHITMGVRNEEQEDPAAPDYIVMKEIHPGGSVDLTLAEAEGIRHALENPPPVRRSARVGEEDEEPEELDEDEEEALDSIRRRPDNPESGVQQHWKTDNVAVAAVNRQTRAAKTGTKEVGGGLERANVGDSIFSLQGPGLNPAGIGPRPDSNKTEMELEDEEVTRKAMEKEQKELQHKADQRSKAVEKK